MDIETIVLPLHILSIIFTAYQIAHAEHLGLLWARGKVEKIELKLVTKYHNRTWFGFALIITTGLILFYPMREFLLSRPQFYVKMGFVAAIFINSFVVGTLLKIPTEQSFASLSLKKKTPLMISGAISTVSWLGAIAGGFFLIPE